MTKSKKQCYRRGYYASLKRGIQRGVSMIDNKGEGDYLTAKCHALGCTKPVKCLVNRIPMCEYHRDLAIEMKAERGVEMELFGSGNKEAIEETKAVELGANLQTKKPYGGRTMVAGLPIKEYYKQWKAKRWAKKQLEALKFKKAKELREIDTKDKKVLKARTKNGKLYVVYELRDSSTDQKIWKEIKELRRQQKVAAKEVLQASARRKEIISKIRLKKRQLRR